MNKRAFACTHTHTHMNNSTVQQDQLGPSTTVRGRGREGKGREGKGREGVLSVGCMLCVKCWVHAVC